MSSVDVPSSLMGAVCECVGRSAMVTVYFSDVEEATAFCESFNRILASRTADLSHPDLPTGGEVPNV